MKIEKLYRLQDGTQADPKDCKVGKDGVLRHKDGLTVAMRADGEPEIIGGDAAAVEAGKAKDADEVKAGAGDEAAAKPVVKTTI